MPTSSSITARHDHLIEVHDNHPLSTTAKIVIIVVVCVVVILKISIIIWLIYYLRRKRAERLAKGCYCYDNYGYFTPLWARGCTCGNRMQPLNGGGNQAGYRQMPDQRYEPVQLLQQHFASRGPGDEYAGERAITPTPAYSEQYDASKQGLLNGRG